MSSSVINIEYDELENFRKVIEEDQTDLDKEIDKMKNQIDRLSAIWKGQDSEEFCAHLNVYLDKMKGIPVCMRNVSSFVKDMSGNFKNSDQAFARKLSTEKKYDDDYKKVKFNSDGFDMSKNNKKGVSA